jgi:hypothetical protein
MALCKSNLAVSGNSLVAVRRVCKWEVPKCCLRAELTRGVLDFKLNIVSEPYYQKSRGVVKEFRLMVSKRREEQVQSEERSFRLLV